MPVCPRGCLIQVGDSVLFRFFEIQLGCPTMVVLVNGDRIPRFATCLSPGRVRNDTVESAAKAGGRSRQVQAPRPRPGVS